MLKSELKTIPQIEEQIRLYYKKSDSNWDEFDDILLHLTMIGMHQNSSIQHIKGFNEVKA